MLSLFRVAMKFWRAGSPNCTRPQVFATPSRRCHFDTLPLAYCSSDRMTVAYYGINLQTRRPHLQSGQRFSEVKALRSTSITSHFSDGGLFLASSEYPSSSAKSPIGPSPAVCRKYPRDHSFASHAPPFLSPRPHATQQQNAHPTVRPYSPLSYSQLPFSNPFPPRVPHTFFRQPNLRSPVTFSDRAPRTELLCCASRACVQMQIKIKINTAKTTESIRFSTTTDHVNSEHDN